MRKIIPIIIIVGVGVLWFVTCSERKYNHKDHSPYSGVATSGLSTTNIDKHDSGYVEYSMELIDSWEKQEKIEKDKYNSKILVGDWFTPHCAMCPNIFFRRNMTFSMWDDGKTKDGDHIDCYFTGTYKVVGDSVYLYRKDGKIISLRHWKGGPKDDDNYYLSKGDDKSGWKYWMVKGN